MKPFAFINATSLETAQEHTRDGKGRYLAGGIDLLGELKEGTLTADRVVNVKTVPGLDAITPGPSAWSIGANVKLAPLARHDGILKQFHGLAEAALEVGSPQIRNVATVGGNLAQHSRCWYYRHRDVSCLKNGGARCYAREAENKYHALFSGNPCISPVVSNLAVALAALDATVTVQRRRGPATWSIDELYASAWENPLAHNSLAPGDLITAVSLPVVPGQKSIYRQLAEKGDFDWALVSCAAAATVSGRRLTNVRLVLGSISPVPHQKDAVNALLSGQDLTEDLAARAADLLLADAVPFPHNAYKIPMAKALARRTLLQLVA